MSTSTILKSPRTGEQSSPRAGCRNSKRCPSASGSSPTSSSTLKSPSPPRQRTRDVLKETMIKGIRKLSPSFVTQYRGVRYREEVNKYVSEIRPTRCSKKIWLGTYDTPEEAARAFDIGNLCCKKKLPLNFADSPKMLKKISSQLSPEEARSAIAKHAKEVARMYSANPNSNCSAPEKPEAAMANAHSEFDQVHGFQLRPEPELIFSQIHHGVHHAAVGFCAETRSETFVEQLPENCADVRTLEVATTMPMGQRGPGSRSWEFDLSIGDVSLPDLSFLDETNDVCTDIQMLEDHIQFGDHTPYGNQVYEVEIDGQVYYYKL